MAKANGYSRDFASYDGKVELMYGYVSPSAIADELDMRIEEHDIGGVSQESFEQMIRDYDAFVQSEGDFTDEVAYRVLKANGFLA